MIRGVLQLGLARAGAGRGEGDRHGECPLNGACPSSVCRSHRSPGGGAAQASEEGCESAEEVCERFWRAAQDLPAASRQTPEWGSVAKALRTTDFRRLFTDEADLSQSESLSGTG